MVMELLGNYEQKFVSRKEGETCTYLKDKRRERGHELIEMVMKWEKGSGKKVKGRLMRNERTNQ